MRNKLDSSLTGASNGGGDNSSHSSDSSSDGSGGSDSDQESRVQLSGVRWQVMKLAQQADSSRRLVILHGYARAEHNRLLPVQIRAMIDSGAQTEIMSADLARRLGGRITEGRFGVAVEAFGHETPLTQQARNIELRLPGTDPRSLLAQDFLTQWDFIVAPHSALSGDYDLLLGTRFVRRFRLNLTFHEPCEIRLTADDGRETKLTEETDERVQEKVTVSSVRLRGGAAAVGHSSVPVIASRREQGKAGEARSRSRCMDSTTNKEETTAASSEDGSGRRRRERSTRQRQQRRGGSRSEVEVDAGRALPLPVFSPLAGASSLMPPAASAMAPALAATPRSWSSVAESGAAAASIGGAAGRITSLARARSAGGVAQRCLHGGNTKNQAQERGQGVVSVGRSKGAAAGQERGAKGRQQESAAARRHGSSMQGPSPSIPASVGGAAKVQAGAISLHAGAAAAGGSQTAESSAAARGGQRPSSDSTEEQRTGILVVVAGSGSSLAHGARAQQGSGVSGADGSGSSGGGGGAPGASHAAATAGEQLESHAGHFSVGFPSASAPLPPMRDP